MFLPPFSYCSTKGAVIFQTAPTIQGNYLRLNVQEAEVVSADHRVSPAASEQQVVQGVSLLPQLGQRQQDLFLPVEVLTTAVCSAAWLEQSPPV